MDKHDRQTVPAVTCRVVIAVLTGLLIVHRPIIGLPLVILLIVAIVSWWRTSWMGLVLLGLIVIPLSIRDSTSSLRRPMFHHLYGRNDRMLLRDWAPIPGRFPFRCETETLGTEGAIVDDDLNLLLVVLAEQGDRDERALYAEIPGAVEVRVGGEEQFPKLVRVERRENAVVVVFPDGTIKEAMLRKEMAVALYDRLVDWGCDGSEGADSPMLSALRLSASDNAALQGFFRGCEQYTRKLNHSPQFAERRGDMMLDFYAFPSEMTDPGKYRWMYDGVTADIPGMVTAVQNVLIHGGLLWAYEIEPDEAQEMQDGGQIRRVEDMLEAIAALDDRNLHMPRPPEQRLKVCCRHFAVLMCSLLRDQHIPARVVNGYATYTWGRGKYENHWVCEYWDIARQHWVRIDPQIDAKQKEIMKVDFDTLDMPAGKFVTGGEAWRLYRSGEVGEDRFGLGGKDGWQAIGERMVRSDVVLEIMARNKLELLPWDGNDLCRKKRLDEQDHALLDKAAEILTAGDAAFSEIRSLYQTNPAFQMSSSWTTTTPAVIEGE